MNLVVPLFRGDEPYAFVRSRPISASSFDVHFRLLIRTFQTMWEDGPMAFRSAQRFLKLAAEGMAPGNADSVYRPLIAEIERLSFVLIGGNSGWENYPLQQGANLLDSGDAAEALNAAVFFTAAWHVCPKQILPGMLDQGIKLWGAASTSLPLTEWIASLPTLTVTGDTQPRVEMPGSVIIQANHT